MTSLINSLDMSLDDLISKKNEQNKKIPFKRNQRNGSNFRSNGPIRSRVSSGFTNSSRRSIRTTTPYSRDRKRSFEKNDNYPIRRNRNFSFRKRSEERRSFQTRKFKTSIFDRLGKKKESYGITIHNLKYDVLENDLKELFGTVGNVTAAYIDYDQAGRSEGVAQVWFETLSEAEKAVRQYNGRTLDGEPMRITIEKVNQRSREVSSSTTFSKSNSKRELFGTALRSSFRDNDNFQNNDRSFRRGVTNRIGIRGQIKSAEDLDAEMDSYRNENEMEDD